MSKEKQTDQNILERRAVTSSETAEPNSMSHRVEWLDVSRGLVLTLMIFMHAYKSLWPTAVWAQNFYPFYFHKFTFGFVGLTGFGLAFLSGRLFRNESVWKYCLSRGFKLFWVSAFILLVFWGGFGTAKETFTYSFYSYFYFPLDVLLITRVWGHMRFIAWIAAFVCFAPFLLSKSRTFWMVKPLLFILGSFIALHFLGPWVQTVEEKPLQHTLTLVIQETLKYFTSGAIGIILGYSFRYPLFRVWYGNIAYASLLISGLLSIVLVEYLAGWYTRSMPMWYVHFVALWSLKNYSVIAFGIVISQTRALRAISKIFSLVGSYALFFFVIHWGSLAFTKKLALFISPKHFESAWICFSYSVLCFCFIYFSCVGITWLRKYRAQPLDEAFKNTLGI